MSDSASWITAIVTEVRKLHPTLNETVAIRIEELLRGPLSERQLTSTEQAHIAHALISLIDTTSFPKTEAER